MKFIELFAGIGGFRYGLEKNNAHESERSQVNVRQVSRSESERKPQLPSSFRCVWSNEIDKYACKIYRKHYGEIHEGDIRSVDPLSIPDHDLLCAGFPCQSFSIAGKRGGFEDTRGTLFFEIARIASVKRPKLLLLENVKGLLSHDSGRTFGTILTTLSELGYFLEWQILNSKDFGVPQNRERVFIVGHLGGIGGRAVFPVETSYGTDNKGYFKTLNSSDWRGANRNQGQNLVNVIPVLTPNRAEKRQNGRRMKEDGEPSFTLTGQDIHGVMTDSRIRRLTPIECERLQGFPDNWTEGISDSQRYKCLGNAVTTNVITAIATSINRKMCYE